MKARFASLTRVFGLALACAGSGVWAQGPATPQPVSGQVTGPGVVELAERSTFDLPAGYVFLNEATTKILLQRLGTPLTGGEVGAVVPPGRDWLAIIKILENGHVSDREWSRFDAGAILARLRNLDQEANQMRQAAGARVVKSVEWEQTPSYDSKAHRLDWAVKAGLSSGEVVNRATALLGRGSVVEFFLVDETRSAAVVKAFSKLAGSLRFRGGYCYEDYLTGDKTAPGGLESLLVGPSENPAKPAEAHSTAVANAPAARELVTKKEAPAKIDRSGPAARQPLTAEEAHAAPIAQSSAWRTWRTIPIWAWVYLLMGGTLVSAATAFLVIKFRSLRRRKKQRVKAAFDANRYFKDLTRDLYRGGH